MRESGYQKMVAPTQVVPNPVIVTSPEKSSVKPLGPSPERKKQLLKVVSWCLAWIAAFLIFFELQFSLPKLIFEYLPGQIELSSPSVSSKGFYKPEIDNLGNHYTWTRANSQVTLNFNSSETLNLVIEMRSAAVAGGVDAPVNLIVNNVQIGQIRPDPAKLDFQSF